MIGNWFNFTTEKIQRNIDKQQKTKKVKNWQKVYAFTEFNSIVSFRRKRKLKKNGKIETKLNGEQNRKMYILQIEITNEKELAK